MTGCSAATGFSGGNGVAVVVADEGWMGCCDGAVCRTDEGGAVATGATVVLTLRPRLPTGPEEQCWDSTWFYAKDRGDFPRRFSFDFGVP